MNEFAAMGGYSIYIWPAYAIFFAVLLIDAIAPMLARRRVLDALRGRLRRQARRNGAAR